MSRQFTVKTKADLERCFPVMKELRPHLNIERYIQIYNEAHAADGYEIVAIEEDGKILALMGYRLLSDFVRGKHIYIDDLISSESARSKGYGAKLLQYAESLSKEMNLSTLRLCAALSNDRGMKFYEREGWAKIAFAYTKSR